MAIIKAYGYTSIVWPPFLRERKLCHDGQSSLDKREYLMIIRDNFYSF